MEATRLQRAAPGVIGIWITLLVVATAYYGAVNWLDADVVMNSVMSLQKVTLFYWGQNRILNVLPAAAWVFRNPAWNLGAVLLLSSATFYASLVMVARLTARAFDLGPWPGYALVVALTAVPSVVFDGVSLSLLAIGHIEYSLPLLLSLIAFSLLAGPSRSPRHLGVAALSVFLAGGLNPASSLVILTIAAARLCWMRKAEWCSLGLGVMGVVALGAWTVISRKYGDSNYGLQDGVAFPQVVAGMQQLAQTAFSTVNAPSLLVLIGSVSAATLFRRLVSGSTPAPNPELARFAYAALIAFCVFFILTLSVNFWVKQNLYHVRYTAFVLFAGLIMLSVWFAQWDWSRWRPVGIVGLLLLVAAAMHDLAVTQLKAPHFKDFAVFNRVPLQTYRSVQLYAGNYWQVWPAVLLQLARNEVGYGVVWRGEVMTQRIRELVATHAEGDILDVYCLDAEESLCTHQVTGLVPSVHYVGSRNDSGVLRQQYQVVPPGLDYVRAGLIALPSTAGTATPEGRATDGKPGVLFFGPYASLPRGKYRLTVRGTTGKVPGVHVEIAVNAGKQVLLSTVPEADASGTIVHEAEVTVPAGVSDLEVRATVTAEDVMTVSGYSLVPVKP